MAKKKNPQSLKVAMDMFVLGFRGALNAGLLQVPATQQECKPFEHKDWEGKTDNGKIMDLGVRKTTSSILSWQ